MLAARWPTVTVWQTGDGVAARGGSAALHCASTTPAAIISARTATRRRKDVNCDESAPSSQIACNEEYKMFIVIARCAAA